MQSHDHRTRAEWIGLLDRQRQLEDLLDATDVMLALLDPQFDFIWVNRAYAETCRMAPETMVGKNHFALYPDADNEAIFRRVRDTGESIFYKDKPFVFPDQPDRGVTYWDWSLAPLQTKAGATRELVFSLRETTRFVRAEEAQRDSASRYHLLFETMPQGVIDYGADGRIRAANPAAQRILGLTLEQLLGQTWPDPLQQVIDEDGAPLRPDAQPAQVAWRTGQPAPATLLGLVNAEPPVRWLRVHAIPQFQTGSEQSKGVYLTFEDVSELMQTQTVLRQREEQLRLALEAAHMASFEWDIVRNEATNTRWGADAQEILPPRMCDPIQQLSELIHPEDRARFLADIKAALTHPDGRYESEFRVQDTEGQTVWLAESGHIEHDAQGQPIRLIGLSQDVTARKQAEALLREADQRKDEFLATLAHELRNPLAPLRTGLEILHRVDPHAPAWSQALGMMGRQLDQLIQLVDDLLDLSRISQGRILLRRQPVALTDSLNQAIETTRPLLEARRHVLHIAHSAEPLVVEGDTLRLTQIFANLLTNAAKYTAPGGQIRIHVERQGTDAVVSVVDTGIGLSSDLLPRVFELFVQDRLVESGEGGLGIGLHLVQRLVAMHGGQVEAHSAGSGQGSTFVVRLPLAELARRERQVVDVGKTLSVAPADPRRILIIDDNQDAAEGLEMLLTLLGHTTRVAYDGFTGLRLGADFRPDVILLDLGMPTLDGYATAERIRAEPWGRAVTLIALTGWGQEEDRQRTRTAGFDHHLMKPVETVTLVDLLAAL